MNTKRVDHACFVDEKQSAIYVLGGQDDQGYNLKSTEKWTFGQNSWQPSANLPETIYQSYAVSSNGNKFVGYVAGGLTWRFRNDIYGLRRRDMMWIKLTKTMKIGRVAHSLINIPANQILGC